MIIRRSLTSAGFPSVLKPVGVCRADGKRPDGLRYSFSRGEKSQPRFVTDYTCVDTLAPSNVSHSGREPGRAATSAEAAKTGKYRESSFLCHWDLKLWGRGVPSVLCS